YKAFNREGFHFGTDDLDAGVVATHYINDIPFDVFLNRFPYLQSHTLIVPDRKFGDKPQNIDPNNQADISILEAMMKLCQNSDLGDKMRIAYNGQGAHASVNHLHFHGFEINPKCIPPIEEYIQNKGNSHVTLDEYIRGAEWFPEKDISVGVPNFIRDIFIRNNFGEPLTYNLYMTPKGVACIPRLHQNTPSYVNTMIESNISSGFAFAELAGVLIAPSEEVFKMDDLELLKKYNLVKDAIQIRTH
ncbi:HIT domain-containing protein, partial [bacterium]|nr:HIT domain-containing protein [bacterium]